MVKFRKMRAAAAGPALTATDDQRFTRLGRFLARTKLDELPQLWNVIAGNMSLVGPRPEDPSFVALRSADYERILQVRPGITGLTQLAFSRECDILDPGDRVGDYVRRLLPQKVQIDRLYVARHSAVMDLRILGWTAMTLFLRSDVAVHRSTGRITRRRRPAQSVPERLQADVMGAS
jgi:lipopolysaccharide/colanic/teichoic acid biosynthesis glycosyltransferase